MENSDSSNEDINWNHVLYMSGKLTDVIMILVTGEGDARARLREASRKILKVSPGMLPTCGDIRKRFIRAYATLTRFHDQEKFAMRSPNSPETIFDETLHRIRNRTAAKVISDLFGAWMDLLDLQSQHRHDLKLQRSNKNL